MATIRQALHTLLKADSSITGLLADGANSVLLWARAETGPSAYPCIVVRDAGRSGGPRRLPFFDQLFYIMCYDDAPAAAAVSYYNIDRILDAVRQAVHGASLTVTGQERTLMCYLDNFDSPDQWDMILEKPYKQIRVRIPGAYLYDYRS